MNFMFVCFPPHLFRTAIHRAVSADNEEVFSVLLADKR